MMLEIGVVVHGPGIIDSGYALKIIKILENYGNVTSRLGGTMGRTAVIDANLEDIINIEDKLLPSESIKILAENSDVVFLLNSGKSTLTGHTFGYEVLSHIDFNVNLIQIERPDKDDGIIIKWNKNTDNELIESVSCDLKLPITDAEDVENQVVDETGYITDENIIKRKVAGVNIGENIMLNGTIIGQVTADELIIIAKDDEIVDMQGGVIKQHGLEKLGSVDLKSAIIKTGLLRRNDNITPRVLKHQENEELYAIYLDHAAEDVYKYRDANVIVCIGDDTTLLTSDIVYRFNIPIIGITDGDLDRVVVEGFKHEKSTIIQLTPGHDDKIGKVIHEKIFNMKNSVNINSIDQLKDNIIEIINKSDIEYEFKFENETKL